MLLERYRIDLLSHPDVGDKSVRLRNFVERFEIMAAIRKCRRIAGRHPLARSRTVRSRLSRVRQDWPDDRERPGSIGDDWNRS
jgi:hypothetical protein